MSQRVSDVYNSLFHYTSWDGLKGILENNTLWATNIRYLNDDSEYYLIKELLVAQLKPEIERELRQKAQDNAKIKRSINEAGGLKFTVERLTDVFVRSMYEASGTEFYVSSFCKEPNNQYETTNGLLSQWRGYGKTVGFAIELDTSEMESLFLKESESFEYTHALISDVIYSHEKRKFRTELKSQIDSIIKFQIDTLLHLFERQNKPDEEQAWSAFHYCATRYKHRGFHEENEVRIVMAPNLLSSEDTEAAKDRGQTVKQEKPIKDRLKENGVPTPHIELFGKDFGCLPIKRIIVGPGRNKMQAADTLKKRVRGKNIEISVSDIPFV